MIKSLLQTLGLLVIVVALWFAIPVIILTLSLLGVGFVVFMVIKEYNEEVQHSNEQEPPTQP